MSFIIGCDIGTTNVKITAFDPDSASILTSHSEGYQMIHPEPDWSEQDPDEIYEAVCNAIREVSKSCELHGQPLGICFSSAMHSILCIDKNGKNLSNLIIWADNRSADIAEKLKASAAGKKMYQHNGTPIHAMTPSCKLIWLKENQKDIFDKTDKFVGIKEYIIFKLTGRFVIDYSIASATGLFNITEKKWDEWTLKKIGIDENKLSKAVSPYHIEKLPGKNDFKLPAGTPLIMGASDGCLANLGSGAISKGTMAITIGTSGAARTCSDGPILDEKMRTFCYILDEDTYVVGGPSNSGAVVFEWMKDNFYPESDYNEIFDAASKIDPGSDGLLFFPYLLGERAPLWSSAVRGGFLGLDIQHTKSHFARAVMEGIHLNLYSIGKILLEKQKVKRIFANGGFAQSQVWVQMLADIFGIEVALNDTVDTGTVGAAMMGLKALGFAKELSDLDYFTPVSTVFKPDKEVHKQYIEVYNKFYTSVEGIIIHAEK
ncbi:gluconokinase [Dyadobacter sp. CY345]|uniref:gluconokinase n=1 Tax=Dyadobacter sp. CY345 TaxID=2909335 RepID=UPI001F46C18F|nr:gluconokinase [Dyadobacter sp. CY345]MCF2442817.1 gluconokinase [Dyadobacter sp. CY345]